MEGNGMTIKINDDGTVRKPNHFTRNVLIIIAIPVALYLIIGLIFMFSFATYQTKSNLSDEGKASLAKEALMPQIAQYVERYGTRGFQDVDLQIETRTFKNFDELVEAMPYLARYKDSESVSGSDIKGKCAKVYEIAEVRPCGNRPTPLPLNYGIVDSDSPSTMEYYTWKYSIYEYKDGSCRFVVLMISG